MSGGDCKRLRGRRRWRIRNIRKEKDEKRQ
jgi:hypothetical protein